MLCTIMLTCRPEESSVQQQPGNHICYYLNAIYDFKSWLSPQINTPHNHTMPHYFMFQCNDQGKAVMYYRKWSSDQWLPLSLASMRLPW